MRIVLVRRICQGFFLVLFLWLCVTATVGTQWWRMRGWPINFILDLDPLTTLSTLLATGTLYAPLLWSVAALVLTLFLGRFFCGFACPLGTLNQIIGWLGFGGKGKTARAARLTANRHRPAQAVKYYLLFFLLACAALGSVQSGLLDPLPLLTRSVNLALAPLFDPGLGVLHDEPRVYVSVWIMGALLAATLGLNLFVPRFFCRFACPLGALFGLSSRFVPWRIGKTSDACGDCHLCEEHCEGACRPSGKIILSECVLCMNCLDACPAGRMTYSAKPSAAGEAPLADMSRRGVLLAGTGLLLAPLWRVGAVAATGRDPALIRPPGALDEERFLARCIRCGQCMRACPSNIIQPALLEAGAQGLWTPTLNFRVGRSGCQPNCVACGQVCPTAAIRPLTLDEKAGRGDFAGNGPIRLGTAFVDRTRCLPWVMDRPCIVCQELCPVSPKAIFTRTVFEPIRDGVGLAVRGASGSVAGAAGKAGAAIGTGGAQAGAAGAEHTGANALAGAGAGSGGGAGASIGTGVGSRTVEIPASAAMALNLSSGDYYLRSNGAPDSPLSRIIGRVGATLTLDKPLPATAKADILVRLQRPFVDAARCIGCGMCEHECPVSGLRAIRVSGENESRSGPGRMLI